MLRVFKQYYPIRNIFFVVGEGIFIFISVFIVSRILLGSQLPVDDGKLILKILLITAVCQACLYYSDLYDFKVSSNFNELSIRLMQALLMPSSRDDGYAASLSIIPVSLAAPSGK